ncbi:PREDICTED: LOW QUALITY PROTEIN: 28S ribosomal protein S15, mitochondrial-like [Branchiostoma belcheri]|uniref:Small ribosomal subunit protein uS15m n=1 Tax=Branchiostoma belcheri TaxID=7741 RepID=A0A6P4YX60_BRABE|nr:PREDICTED: LOW QUALITY PROTEIN: 28S ribosomal protein S15, mitochondrial-like [Branchiostoma belcheri]
MLTQRLMHLTISSKSSFIPAVCCNSARVVGNSQAVWDRPCVTRAQPIHTSSQVHVQQRFVVKRKQREKKLREAQKVKIISQLEGLDLTQFKPGWEKSKELQTADDTIKRIFSLEFASSGEKVNFLKQDMIRRVQKHPNDYRSLEVRIAHMTIHLRALQEAQERDKKNTLQKQLMLIKQQKRDKLLRQLRKTNYESFELVCRELGITLDLMDSERILRKLSKKGQLLQDHRQKIFEEIRRRKKEEEEAAAIANTEQGEGNTAMTSSAEKIQ